MERERSSAIAARPGCGDLAVPPHGQDRSGGGLIDVTVPGDGGRARRRGIRLHRSLTLSPAHCTIRQGIPVTTPGRTLEDLRHVLPGTKLASALREAEYLKLAIGDRPNVDRTRTELEALFLALCRRHRLPQPEVNAATRPLCWSTSCGALRVFVVEVDGWESHRTAVRPSRRTARGMLRLMLLGFTTCCASPGGRSRPTRLGVWHRPIRDGAAAAEGWRLARRIRGKNSPNPDRYSAGSRVRGAVPSGGELKLSGMASTRAGPRLPGGPLRLRGGSAALPPSWGFRAAGGGIGPAWPATVDAAPRLPRGRRRPRSVRLRGRWGEACERILAALAFGRPAITVHGDYDVDGVCATAILVSCLRELEAAATG